VHRDSEWTKTIDVTTGGVHNYDWSRIYAALRTAANVTEPGYLWHEAVAYVGATREWVFAPRKRSPREPYAPREDQYRGSNLLLRSNNDFSEVRAVSAGPLEDTFGFTSIRAVPGAHNVFLALKSKEVDDQVHSKLTVIGADGEVLLDDAMPEVGCAAPFLNGTSKPATSVGCASDVLPLRNIVNARRHQLLGQIEAWLGPDSVASTAGFCRAGLAWVKAAGKATANADASAAKDSESDSRHDQQAIPYNSTVLETRSGGEGLTEPVGERAEWPSECRELGTLERAMSGNAMLSAGHGTLVEGIPMAGLASVVEGMGVARGFVDLGTFKFEGLTFVP